MTVRELIREMNKLSDEERQCEIVIGEINMAGMTIQLNLSGDEMSAVIIQMVCILY